jgi:hypothetical protein
MRASFLRSFAVALPVLLSSGVASAHFTLIEPKPSSTQKDGKGSPPCGPSANSGVVTEATGGQEIDLVVDETVNHGGFYRVALALNSPSELPPDNVVYDANNMVLPANGMPQGNSDHADWQMTPKFPVLADHLFAHTQNDSPKKYSGKVVLPNVTCAKCTLQVIEFMAPHGYNGPAPNGGGYFYHNCADLKITADPGKPIFDPGAPSGGAGGMGGAGASGGATAGANSGGGGAGGGAGGVAAGGAPMTAGTSSGGTPGASGSTSTAGSAVSGGSASGGSPSGGGSSGAPPATGGTTTDDGGCMVGRPSRGGASLLAALGLGYALARRRRGSM